MAEATRPRALIYARVSTTDQAKGFSLQTQEQFCREYADQNGYEVDRVFVEPGVSARTATRPELQRMLDYVASNHAHVAAVIVLDATRWARDAYDHLWLKRELKHHSVGFLSVTEEFPDTPDGHMHKTIVAARSQFDNEQRAEKCVGGMKAAVAAGRFCWQAPRGYVNGRKGKGRSLEFDEPSIVMWVRKSFDLIDAGFTVTQALEQVRNEGLTCRNGHGLSRNTFRTMLMNKRYIGYIESFGMTVRGDFDPIVPEDVFYRVQSKLHRKSKAAQVHYSRDNPEFPLRGVVRCPTCGYVMTASQSTGNGGKYGYYSCSKCGKSRFRKEELEQWFVQDLQVLSLKKECVEALSAAIDANLEGRLKAVGDARQKVSSRVASLKVQGAAILRKCADDIIPDAMAKDWFQKAAAEEEDLKCQLALIAESTFDTPEVLKRGLGILSDLASVWEKSNLSTRQQLQMFVFPQGLTARKEGFGTDSIALCLQPKELSSAVITDVVGPPGFEPRTKWL